MSENRLSGCLGVVMFLGVSGGLASCFGICFLPTFGCIGIAVVDKSTATTARVKIAGHRWERTIDVEELTREFDESWCDDVPKGAHIVEEWSEKSGKYSSRHRCRYWQLEWTETDHLTKSGKAVTPAPAWPKPPNDGCATEGCKRPGDKHERYWVVLDLPRGEDRECEVDEMARWARYKKGKSASVEVGGLIGSVFCDTLKAP